MKKPFKDEWLAVPAVTGACVCVFKYSLFQNFLQEKFF